MDRQPKDPLPIGRAAFAKAICADWISENSKTILIILSFTLSQIAGKISLGKKSDYAEVHRAFHAWSAGEAHDQKMLKSLEAPLGRHPELEAKFGAHIAQRLLCFGDVKKADRYALAALNRAGDLISPYYERFSRNTLLISQGKFAPALNEAKQLKTELEGDDVFWAGRDKFIHSGTVLYAYNLLRIAALERQLGSNEGELKAWEELVTNAGWNQHYPLHTKTYDPEAYALLAQNFKQGDLSLLDYIEQRKKELISLR
jgi:hypothetical protein